MVSSTRQAIACILVVVGVAAYGYSQTNPPKEAPTATISGKVTVLGKSVAGVIITLRSDASSGYQNVLPQRGVSDSDGVYQIKNVPPGNYSIEPAGTPFVSANDSNRRRTVIVNKAETIESFDFSLAPGGVITGRVLSRDGLPLIEEEVNLFTEQGRPMPLSFPAAITDDRGVYRIYGLKPGSYKIAAGRESVESSRGAATAHVRSYYPGVSDIAQATVLRVGEAIENTNIDITLGRLLTTYTASGRVVDGETHQPVPNVHFGYRRFGPSPVNRGNLGATDEKGEFKLKDLAPGQYAAKVFSEPGSYVRAEEVSFEIIDQDVTGLEVKTIKGASLSGVAILEPSPDPAALEYFRKAEVVAFVAETGQGSTRGVRSPIGANGSFHIGGLPTGTATFMVVSRQRFRIIRVERNGVDQVRGFGVKEGEDVTGLRIVVGYADALIRGALEIENGTLPPNARISVSARRFNEAAWPAQVDARGQFQFDPLIPGTYELTVSVVVPGARAPLAFKKQSVVAISGSVTNVTINLDLNAAKTNP